MLPALEPHRLMSWLLDNTEAHSQCLVFLQSTDECEEGIRYHRNHYHEQIVQASAKTLSSCNRRAQIKCALYHKPQGSRTARRESIATAMSHTTSVAYKASYLHAYGAVMTNDCECHGWVICFPSRLGYKANDALQGMRKQQATATRPSLVMSRTVSFRQA